MNNKIKKDVKLETADGKIKRLPGKEPLLKDEESTLDGIAADSSDDEFDPKELAMGIEVELEHTRDMNTAKKIAKDHLKEIKDYYTRLKRMEENAKKSLSDRWSDLKKALNNKEAISDVDDLIGDEDSDEADQNSEDQGSEEQPSEDQTNDESEDQSPQDDANNENVAIHEEIESPEEKEKLVIEALREHGYSDVEIAHIVHGHTPPQTDPVDSAKVDAIQAKVLHDGNAASIANEAKSRLADIESEHARRIKDIEFDDIKNQKEVTKLKNEHAKRMMDLEFEHEKKKKEMELSSRDGDEAREIAKINVEHHKKMMELEYEIEKKMKMLELEQRKHEMEMKLFQKKEAMKVKAKADAERVENEPKEDDKEVEPEKNENKNKKLKKSDEEEFEVLEKYDIGSWKYDANTRQYNHPEHGAMAIRRNDNGYFEAVHNGQVVASSPDIKSVHSHMTERMKGLMNQSKISAGGGVKMTPGTRITIAHNINAAGPVKR